MLANLPKSPNSLSSNSHRTLSEDRSLTIRSFKVNFGVAKTLVVCGVPPPEGLTRLNGLGRSDYRTIKSPLKSHQSEGVVGGFCGLHTSRHGFNLRLLNFLPLQKCSCPRGADRSSNSRGGGTGRLRPAVMSPRSREALWSSAATSHAASTTWRDTATDCSLPHS